MGWFRKNRWSRRELCQRIADLQIGNGRLQALSSWPCTSARCINVERALFNLLSEARTTLKYGRAYMKYHAEKFYGDSDLPAPTGLTPTLDALEKAISAASWIDPEGYSEASDGVNGA